MKTRTRTLLLWSATLVILALVLWGLYASGFFQALSSRSALTAYIERCAPWSHLAFFGIQLVSVVVAPIPSNITAAVGGALFGFLPAFLLTWGAVVLGSMIVFALARVLGQRFVSKFVGERISEKYLDIIRRKESTFLTLAFLFPFFPDDLLCILAGLTELSWKRFLVLCLLARPWGLLVAALLGSSALEIPLWGMALLGVAGLIVFVVAMKYGDRAEEAILRTMRK